MTRYTFTIDLESPTDNPHAETWVAHATTASGKELAVCMGATLLSAARTAALRAAAEVWSRHGA